MKAAAKTPNMPTIFPFSIVRSIPFKAFLVGKATFDCELGQAFCLTFPEYAFLKKEMLQYAKDNLSKYGKIDIIGLGLYHIEKDHMWFYSK